MIAALLITLAGLPVVERPATINAGGNTVAIMITGDGGWRPVDERVTKRLRAAGIPVAGLLAPDYFRKRRTPDESAADLDRIIRFYQEKWQKPRVVLIGYSRGADSLPFMVNRLSPEIREVVDLVALLAPEPWIDFKFNPWWSPARYFHHEPQYPVLPEVEKMRALRVTCVYGENEKDSLCPSLDPAYFTIVREPGGHHFGGKYDEVANAILSELARRR